MNILIGISHPAHVHYFRILYKLLQRKHDVTVICKSNESIRELLDYHNINYLSLGEKGGNLLSKIGKQTLFNIKALNVLRDKKIDVALGNCTVHASLFSRCNNVIFDDDDQDVQPLTKHFVSPFSTTVLSPDTLSYENLKNAVYYPGYHELAYLHPKRFAPDKNILRKYCLKEGEPFFILRFNAFKAHHDIGMGGMSLQNKRDLIKLLNRYGKIFITTEDPIEKEFESYKVPVRPEEMHSLMSFATMFISDSQTMTSEAAVLGVPAIRCNSFVGRLSNIEELEKKYNLTYGFLPKDFDWMLYRIKTLLENPNLKDEWREKRNRMLEDKIDVTAFWLWFIENYPKSEEEVRHPEFSFERFK
ncbi:MAG TPA: DUF354 domain-containing protein [Fermentimonas sp.]|nr:DUF354 domain-containing protein [Fermentimonas sp.]